MLVPKGYALGDDYEFFGYTAQEQAEFAYSALSRRLKVIGVRRSRYCIGCMSQSIRRRA